MIIKPPSGGGTEILRAISKHEDSQQLDAITPSTLSSGLKMGKDKHGGEKILEKLNGKRVITLDMSRYLGERADVRRQIFSQLRGAYDGSVVTAFGSTAGIVDQQDFRFDWIVAATPAIERFRGFEAELGERFVDVRLNVDRMEVALKAAETEVEGATDEMRNAIRSVVCGLIDECRYNEVEAPTYWKRIARLGDATATLRSPVVRDRTHDVIAMPDPEVGGRLTKVLIRLSKGMAMLRRKAKPDELDYLALLRVASDSIPMTRLAVLACVLDGITDTSEIAENTRVGKNTVGEELENLRLLGVIKRGMILTKEWEVIMEDTGLNFAITRPAGYTVIGWAKVKDFKTGGADIPEE